MQPETQFNALGWVALTGIAGLHTWIDSVRPVAARLAAAQAGGSLRCGGTWYAGVNILPNAADGAVPGGPPLPDALTEAVSRLSGFHLWDWEPAQISVCYPGYPRQDPEESDAAFRYRRDHDAAHLDGLLPEGPQRRRHLREHHAFILGIPLVDTDPGAAPLIVHEGSHAVMRDGFKALLGEVEPGRWAGLDVTEPYQALRRKIFAAGRRRAVHVQTGSAYLLHRHALHGVAPWTEGARAPVEGRMIAYFRPNPAPGASPAWWLGTGSARG